MSWLVPALVFAALALGFAVTERLRPARRRRPLGAPSLAVDASHLVLSNAVPNALVNAGIVAALAGLAGVGLTAGAGARLPLAVQVALLLAASELLFYALHRAMHSIGWMWRIHRIHHSAAELDWVAGFRQHVLEAVLYGLALAPLHLVGFSPVAWLWFGAVSLFFTGFAHLNARIDLGRLEGVVVTPRYHAAHHAVDPAAQRRHLAARLALVDRLFGTATAAAPATSRFGLGDADPAPDGWWAQQTSPFRRSAGG